MSNPRSTPLRLRSSLANVSTPQPPPNRASFTDLRRPPSRSFRPASPRMPAANRSRPGSAMGNSSRPTTPCFVRNQEPYTGSITVSIRPNPHSISPSVPCPWTIDHHENIIGNTTDANSFKFDNVFPPETSLTNQEVYQRSCSPLVNSFLSEGYNATVFAYGMTGSGKTFSMRGDDSNPGFVRLAIDDIFDRIDLDRHTKQYSLHLNYLEIYNEKIIDLLAPSSSTTAQDLKIRDDAVYGTKIIGITTQTISTKLQVLLLIRVGDNNRKTSATDFNARSSRSHSILQIRINVVDLTDNTEQNSTLSLCDLAGSERATSSLERRKEGAYINKSLLALSTVINKLSLASSDGAGSPTSTEHIPYRDSKLTRLLQPALSGSSLVLILCTIQLGTSQANSSQQFTSETYNTLRFAARAKDIVMNVDLNKKSALTDADSLKLMEELRKTIEEQRNEIQMLKMLGGTGKRSLSNSSTSSNGMEGVLTDKHVKIAQLESEIRILNEKLEHLTRLTDLQKTETVLLRNDSLNDMLGMDIDNTSLQVMMSNLEDFYKRMNYEMDEHKAYITHLENQLKISHQQTILASNGPNSQAAQTSKLSDRQVDAVLKDQEEEIWHLKELLKDKDHIINGLTKTSKLRRLVDSNSTNFPSDSNKKMNLRTGAVTPPPHTRADKENAFGGDLREFNISPRKAQGLDIPEHNGMKFVI